MQHQKKDVIIASASIALFLVSIFILVQLFFSRAKINIDSDAIVSITPAVFDKNTEILSKTTIDETENSKLPGVFAVGMLVEIYKTEGDGLRIRRSAELSGTPMFLGKEGEIFRIVQGPSLDDNKVWWKIESIDNTARNGWAVQDYLKRVE